MFDLLSMLGYPSAPAQAGALVFLALSFGIQAKLKTRPYLLAIQASLAAFIIGKFADTLFNVGFDPTAFITNFMALTFGAFLGHFIVAWLIIALVFFLRFRNHNASIFTRNRNK